MLYAYIVAKHAVWRANHASSVNTKFICSYFVYWVMDIVECAPLRTLNLFLSVTDTVCAALPTYPHFRLHVTVSCWWRYVLIVFAGIVIGHRVLSMPFPSATLLLFSLFFLALYYHY
jgi:hypothetical protein